MKIKITKVSNQRINVRGSVPKGKKIRRDERIKKLLYQRRKKKQLKPDHTMNKQSVIHLCWKPTIMKSLRQHDFFIKWREKDE